MILTNFIKQKASQQHKIYDRLKYCGSQQSELEETYLSKMSIEKEISKKIKK